MAANGKQFGHGLLIAHGYSKHVRAYPKGTLIFSEGERSTGVYLVTEGQVQISVLFGERRLPIRVVGPGFVLGLPAALSGGQYPFTAEALDDTNLAFVPLKDLQTAMRDNPEYCFQLTESLGEELVELSTHTLHVLRLQTRAKGHI